VRRRIRCSHSPPSSPAGANPCRRGEWLLEAAHERGLVEQRPGVAVPTADPVDGLAYSTRLHAPWSGDPDATREALADATDGDPANFDADDHRAIGSLVALDVVGADGAADAAASSIGRTLRPFATPDGLCDARRLRRRARALARTEPGTGTALAMGHDVREAALSMPGASTDAALTLHSRTPRPDATTACSSSGSTTVPSKRSRRLRRPTGRRNRPFSPSTRDTVPRAIGRSPMTKRRGGHRDPRRRPLGATVEGVARELETGATDADSETAADAGTAVEYDVGHRRGYLRYDPTWTNRRSSRQ